MSGPFRAAPDGCNRIEASQSTDGQSDAAAIRVGGRAMGARASSGRSHDDDVDVDDE